jgi:hypothetical protein
MSSAVVMKAAEGERTKFAAYRRQPTTYSDAQSRASGLRSSSSRVWPLGTKWATNCGDRGQALSGAVEVGAQLRRCPTEAGSLCTLGTFLTSDRVNIGNCYCQHHNVRFKHLNALNRSRSLYRSYVLPPVHRAFCIERRGRG